MAMFTSMFQQDQQKRRPTVGGQSPYNVPIGDIRPGQNTVNISGAGGDVNRGGAFDAFSRLYQPFMQSQVDLLNKNPMDAMGNPINRQPYGQQDITSALMNMFQRAEDVGTLSKYGGFSPATRKNPYWG